MHLAHVLGRDLLQTPSAAAGTGGQVRRGGDRADELLLGGQVKALLPTPNPFHSGNTESPEEWLERRADVEARTGTRHGPALPVVAWSITDGHPLSQDGDGPRLHKAVRTLPTPKATNNENRPSEGFGTGGVGYAIAHTDWAQYGPAIRIWENVLGRPAPPPTIAGKRGEPRLNPALTEWMMGLPEGHITSVPGLSREAQLKAAGNGVVPQQAAAALLLMIVDLVPLVETYAAEEGEGSAA